MRILLADALPDDAVARLTEAGDEVTVDPTLTADTLGDALEGAEVLVVRSTEVDAETLARGNALGLVVRAGAGTNTIDCAAAADLGVFVCNVPGRNALAVAELTLGLLLAIDRHIADATADLRAGRWNKRVYADAGGLHGRRFGIIGLGEIGVATAARASAFGMDVVAVAKPGRDEDLVERAERAGVRYVADLDELLSTSDVVSLHVPGGPATRHLVDAAFLARLRSGAILLNTSRGDVIDESALLAALDERNLRAGLDVFADEPASGTGTFDSPLARHPRVVATHHIGASTAQAQAAVAAGTIEVIDAFRRGSVIHCVNLQDAPTRTATLFVRHLDRVGVLAGVLDVLRAADLNVATMSNQIFAGATAAVATIDVDGPVVPAVLDRIRAVDHVIGARVTPG